MSSQRDKYYSSKINRVATNICTTLNKFERDCIICGAKKSVESRYELTDDPFYIGCEYVSFFDYCGVCDCEFQGDLTGDISLLSIISHRMNRKPNE